MPTSHTLMQMIFHQHSSRRGKLPDYVGRNQSLKVTAAAQSLANILGRVRGGNICHHPSRGLTERVIADILFANFRN